MSTPVFHALVGYDKASGSVVAEYDVPASKFAHAKQVARVGEDDPEAVLCYMLTPEQAADIAGAIGVQADTRALNFYLEGFDAPLASRAA